MKKYLLISTLLAAISFLHSQPYGNEWIDFNGSSYFKVKVFEDGIYRIPYSALAAASPAFSTARIEYLTMYHNGEKVPLYISSRNAFIDSAAEYIEFFGEKNKGFIDSLLYRSADDQINPIYSLFSDTSIYFLAISQTPNNPRLTVVGNNLNNLPAPLPYFMYKSVAPYSSRIYYQGYYKNSGFSEIYKPSYDNGEGYTYNQFFGNTYPRDYTVATPYLVSNGPSSKLKVHFTNSSSLEYHAAKIKLNNIQVYQQFPAIRGYKLNKETITIANNLLTNGNNLVTFSDTTNATSSQQNIVGYLEIEYPRLFNFGGADKFAFELDTSSTKRYLEISGFNNNVPALLYDLTGRFIYQGAQPSGNAPFKFYIQGSLQNQKEKHRMYLRSDNAFITINSIEPITFVNYLNFGEGEYVIISHPKLYVDNNGTDWVDEYRKYRSRRFTVCPSVVNVETLYDQFSYGIRKSPLAIRNFINYIKNNWNTNVKYTFVIGKGRPSVSIRTDTVGYAQCLIPTYGYPTSDILLASSRGSDSACVAIGRLAAETGEQVHDYLEKVIQYEEAQETYTYSQPIPPKIWQKQIIHLGGGTSVSEQLLLGNYLADYGRIAADTFWGGNVFARNKTTAAPVDESLSQVIKQRINDGTSIISFFGHSATGYFDFSIDEPETYVNQGRYPLIFSLGCFVGLIHDRTRGYSERFVFKKNGGAIAFLAANSISDIGGLNTYATGFYKNFSLAKYTEPLGICIQHTHNAIIRNLSNADLTLAITEEMTLHGDPGLKLNQYPKPDYAVDASSVFFNPTNVVASSDSFDVNVVVSNLGKAIDTTIAVTLKRTVYDSNNNREVFNYKEYISAPYYRDTVIFRLPVTVDNVGFGQNTFEPYVEADFIIDEMAEGNNGLLDTSGLTLFIQSDDVIPIYPYEFAIVPQAGVTLKASTVNPFAAERYYRMEIDTSELFNTPLSAYHQETTILQRGGVLKWTPNLPYVEDSMVYYWRVKVDTANTNWHYSSFIYLRNEYPGWNQSHYFQWKKDDYLLMSLDTQRVFQFSPTTNEIYVSAGKSVNFKHIFWEYNKVLMYYHRMFYCSYNSGLTFAVIDSVTGLPWETINVNGDDWGDRYGNYHCASQYYKQKAFEFPTSGIHPPTVQTTPYSNVPWSVVIKRFIDSIPDGHFLLMYTTNTPSYTTWDTTLVNTLSQLGFPAQQYADGLTTGPFIFFTKKNRPSFQNILRQQPSFNSPLTAIISFTGSWYQGQFTSPRIGPAAEWGSVHWQKRPFNNQFTDTDELDVIGINTAGLDTVLLTTTQPNNFINNLGSTYINAAEYPYIKLRLRTRDSTWRTPTQPYYWRVLYKKPAEAAINPSAHFVLAPIGQAIDTNIHYLVNDSFDIGQGVHVEVALENVTDVHMDSMLTKYILRDAGLSNSQDTIRYDSLRALQSMILSYDATLTGNNYQGLNKLIIEANPYNDQIEQYHFNNFAEISFKAASDKINPLLDVTFDNYHIMNGDIVSAKPNILITLKDENKQLALDDNSLIDVYMKYPGENTPRKVDYGTDPITFYPADAEQLQKGNKAVVEYKPELLTDGTYELIIKDRDRNGNNSSTTGLKYEANIFYDYKISFKVINKPMITNVLNYPNPFTTSTRFVFTLTGSEVPDVMKIQIITVKGTVVKEINKEELGSIRIGNNITEYAWDGRDQYGDLLANGVYFYRVVTRLDDKRMDHMDQSFDKYFKKGFGKLVILR